MCDIRGHKLGIILYLLPKAAQHVGLRAYITSCEERALTPGVPLRRYMKVVATIATALTATHDKGTKEVLIWRLILREACVAVDAIGAVGELKPLDRAIEASRRYRRPRGQTGDGRQGAPVQDLRGHRRL